jgi:hypothetical protein
MRSSVASEGQRVGDGLQVEGKPLAVAGHAGEAGGLQPRLATVEQKFDCRKVGCARLRTDAGFADQAEGEPEAEGGEGKSEGDEWGHGKRPALLGAGHVP